MKRAILTICLFMPLAAFALEPWTELELGYSVYRNPNPDNSLSSGPFAQLKIGVNNVYAWSSLEAPDYNIVGQKINFAMLGFGGGARFAPLDNVTVFAEFGYFLPSTSGTHEGREYEVSTVTLRNRHLVGNPYVAAGQAAVFDYASYEIAPGFGGRIGAAYSVAIGKNASVSIGAAYRIVALEQTYTNWNGDTPREDCESVATKICWWEMTDSLSINAVQLSATLQWRF